MSVTDEKSWMWEYKDEKGRIRDMRYPDAPPREETVETKTKERSFKASSTVDENLDRKEMKIDINKKYQTRDGREVRIYCTDGGHTYPVHGAVYRANFWESTLWTEDGCYYQTKEPCASDLVEVKRVYTVDVWVRLWDFGVSVCSDGPISKSYSSGLLAQKKFTLTIKKGEFDE